MHLQKHDGEAKDVPSSFIDKPIVRKISYAIAALLLIGFIAGPISDGEIPSIGNIIMCFIIVGYIYSDQKIVRARKVKQSETDAK